MKKILFAFVLCCLCLPLWSQQVREVKGTVVDSRVGGLVGEMHGGTVEKCYATAAWLAKDTDKWLTTTHPRTAIGLSKDGKTIVQVAVDGRWTSSNTDKRAIGMSTDLLAKLMRGLGCYKAMNFDGGGGTQMWVYGHGDIHHIVNHPHNSWPVYGTKPEHYSVPPVTRYTSGAT